jgi:predicted ribosomally synthesized peptide with nif11-like leader
MSIAEIERFAADVSSDAALRVEAEKACAQASPATPVDGVTAFAKAKGYAFTASELREHTTAKAEAAGSRVSDAELDGLSGGQGDGIAMHLIGYMIGVVLSLPSKP